MQFTIFLDKQMQFNMNYSLYKQNLNYLKHKVITFILNHAFFLVQLNVHAEEILCQCDKKKKKKKPNQPIFSSNNKCFFFGSRINVFCDPQPKYNVNFFFKRGLRPIYESRLKTELNHV